MRQQILVILAILLSCVKLDNANQNDPKTPKTETFEIPKCIYPNKYDEENVFFEKFEDFSTWKHSKNKLFEGKFVLRNDDYDEDEEVHKTGKHCHGILAPKKMSRYAISKSFKNPFEVTDLVVQFVVRMHSGLQCGGAYIKLIQFDPKNVFSSDHFSNETPYTIMFGPDRCGSTDKVHFIFKYKNPKSGKYYEHHLKNQITSVNDQKSHLYTLILRKNNTFSIHIDLDERFSGSLFENFDPSLIPDQQIDDPEDIKPENWVDEEEIPDPNAKKPDDWDEDAPEMIIDPESKMPNGWQEDAPFEIPDPEAKEPENWDTENDGQWEPPLIKNPICQKIGCGKWIPNKIPNPNFKGKWTAPLIKNPDFKGHWKAKQIENPEYFNVSQVELDRVLGIGIDIWTVDKGIEFSDFYVHKGQKANFEAAKKFAETTFLVRKKAEDYLFPNHVPDKKEKEVKNKMMDFMFYLKSLDWKQFCAYFNENPIYFGIILLSLLPIFYILCNSKKKSKTNLNRQNNSSIINNTNEGESFFDEMRDLDDDTENEDNTTVVDDEHNDGNVTGETPKSESKKVNTSQIEDDHDTSEEEDIHSSQTRRRTRRVD